MTRACSRSATSTKSFGGVQRRARRVVRRRARARSWADRAQRLGQVDAVQLHPGPAPPDAGEVRSTAATSPACGPRSLNRLGVSRTFQLLQVFPQLTVRENLILAGQEHRGSRLVAPVRRARRRPRRRGRPHARVLPPRARSRTRRRAACPTASRSCSTPPWPSCRARAWCCSTSRPAASIRPCWRACASGCEAINRETRATFVVIEHNMEFVMALCSRLIVLAEGRIIAEGTPAEVRAIPP